MTQSYHIVYGARVRLSEAPGACPSEFPHVSSHLQDLADVVDKLPYVGSSLTTDSKQDLTAASLDIPDIVDSPSPKISLNDCPDRRPLKEIAYKLLDNAMEPTEVHA